MSKKLKLYYVSTSSGANGFVHHTKKKAAIIHAMNVWGCPEDSIGVATRVRAKEPGELIAPKEVVDKHHKEIVRLSIPA